MRGGERRGEGRVEEEKGEEKGEEEKGEEEKGGGCSALLSFSVTRTASKSPFGSDGLLTCSFSIISWNI